MRFAPNIEGYFRRWAPNPGRCFLAVSVVAGGGYFYHCRGIGPDSYPNPPKFLVKPAQKTSPKAKKFRFFEALAQGAKVKRGFRRLSPRRPKADPEQRFGRREVWAMSNAREWKRRNNHKRMDNAGVKSNGETNMELSRGMTFTFGALYFLYPNVLYRRYLFTAPVSDHACISGTRATESAAPIGLRNSIEKVRLTGWSPSAIRQVPAANAPHSQIY